MKKYLYIHIPFCRKKCDYCSFYSQKYQPELAISYFRAIRQQMLEIDAKFDGIYIGGGTPTTLSLDMWEDLLKIISKISYKNCEFTVEANPESLDKRKVELFNGAGVNRISIGVQSLSKIVLGKLGRIHSFEEAVDKIHMTSENGIKNINIDLIFGIWGQTLNSWKRDINEALKLPIKHISLYCLSYDPGTPTFARLKNNKITPLNDDLLAKMYKFNYKYLDTRGFLRYEVSNFSDKGYECKHNLNYWDNGSYLGLGSSAFSYQKGVRSRVVSDINLYIKRVKKGMRLTEFSEKLTDKKRAQESAALKIRTSRGISLKWFKKNTGFDLFELAPEALGELFDGKLIKQCEDRLGETYICLTQKGFLFSDTVSSAFF